MRLVLALLMTFAAAAAPGSAFGADLTATPSTLSGAFAAAQPGDTIVLAAGDYGTWPGGAKAGMVTLRAAAGAHVTMKPHFTSASSITLDGLTLPEVDVAGSSHDISIVNSVVTGSSLVDASGMHAANIVFDHDTFDGIDACSDCYEGRLTVKGSESNTATVGVAITNSHFGKGGGSDGIQITGDAAGVQIGPGNEFADIQQGDYAAHVDSIQLYGSHRTRIVGNWFHDDDTIIMAPDGGDHEYIANNVMVGDGYGPAVQLGSHVGTQFVHNTVKGISVHADAKAGEPDSRDVVVSDNVFAQGASTNATEGACSNCTVSYNLFSSSGDASGTNALIGTPVFAGGSAPASWSAYALAAGSPGKGNASDGTDRGIDVGGGPGGGLAGAPAPGLQVPSVLPGSLAGGKRRASVARISWSARPRLPRVGARVILRVHGRGHGRRCLWTLAQHVAGHGSHDSRWRRSTRRGCTIAVRFHRAGPVRVALRVTHRSGEAARAQRTIQVRA